MRNLPSSRHQALLHKKGINIGSNANVHKFIESQSQLNIKKVKEIITDDSLLLSIEKKIDTMHIKNGLDPIADFIYQSSDSQRSGVLS